VSNTRAGESDLTLVGSLADDDPTGIWRTGALPRPRPIHPPKLLLLRADHRRALRPIARRRVGLIQRRTHPRRDVYRYLRLKPRREDRREGTSGEDLESVE
jgi:hypothetical protein